MYVNIQVQRTLGRINNMNTLCYNMHPVDWILFDIYIFTKIIKGN